MLLTITHTAMIIHLYRHNLTPYLSDTGGFWASIDEMGQYRGQKYTVQEWETEYHVTLRQGTHPDTFPPEIVSFSDDEAYSIYWFEAPPRR